MMKETHSLKKYFVKYCKPPFDQGGCAPFERWETAAWGNAFSLTKFSVSCILIEKRFIRMKVNVKKLDPCAKLPVYGSQYAAGADLYACSNGDIVIEAGETAFIRTGIAIELPEGMVGLVFARSGLASKQDLAPANKVGVVDCDYRGEILVALHNHGKEPRTVKNGDRIAQLVITPYYTAEFTEAKELSETVRGAGGFGSTGKR